MDTVLLVNKPLGWTSFDVVKKIRGALQIKKIGHAGTLDPLASGLLLLCTGIKTKSISSLQELPKTYTGQMVLGKTTASMDLETPFTSTSSYAHITAAMVRDAAATFVGSITQIPPAYSALHVNGQRAYTMARKGIKVTLAPRCLTIYAFTLTAINFPLITFELVCSKGTYVRSLAHDVGEKLGVGAYLHTLCRTQIGDYRLDQAYCIEKLIETYTKHNFLYKG